MGKIRKGEMFVFDYRRGGLLYAVVWLLDLPYLFDGSRFRLLRGISDRTFEWCGRKVAGITERPLNQTGFVEINQASGEHVEEKTGGFHQNLAETGIDLKKLREAIGKGDPEKWTRILQDT